MSGALRGRELVVVDEGEARRSPVMESLPLRLLQPLSCPRWAHGCEGGAVKEEA